MGVSVFFRALETVEICISLYLTPTYSVLQRQRDARVLMPPPRSLAPNRARHADKRVISSSSNTSNSTSGESFKNRRVPNHPGDNNSNLSSNSDAHKPRRKRRHKKKKKLV
jgi:hypothetical protein